eukprot:g32251.t1
MPLFCKSGQGCYFRWQRCRGVTKDADPMGAVTAFRSCEVRWVRIEVGGTLRARQAGGAPAAAYRQGIHLMRRELLRWAKAPWRSPTAERRVRQLDEARGVALCADLWNMYRTGPISDPGLSLALERRLRRPAREALGLRESRNLQELCYVCVKMPLTDYIRSATSNVRHGRAVFSQWQV